MAKKTAKSAEKSIRNLKPKAGQVKGGMTNADANRGQAEKRLSDHRNEMRRNWAP